MKFGENLKAARKAAGISQQALSEKAEIPKRTIEEWEAGRRTPPGYVQNLLLDWIKNRIK